MGPSRYLRSLTYLGASVWDLLFDAKKQKPILDGDDRFRLVLNECPYLLNKHDAIFFPCIDDHYSFVVVRNIRGCFRNLDTLSTTTKKSSRIHHTTLKDLKMDEEDTTFILIMDSMWHDEQSANRHRVISEVLEALIKHAIIRERRDGTIVEDLPPLNIKSYSVHVPTQKGKYDCGLCALKYSKHYFGNIHFFVEEVLPSDDKNHPFFQRESMPDVRLHMKNLIDTLLYDADKAKKWGIIEKCKYLSGMLKVQFFSLTPSMLRVGRKLLLWRLKAKKLFSKRHSA